MRSLRTQTPNQCLIKWRGTSAHHPQTPSAPRGCVRPLLPPRTSLTCYIRSVVYEQISRNHRFISRQNDLLEELGAKVFLHPGVLEGERRAVSTGRLTDGAGAAQQSGSSARHEAPHREHISLNKFTSEKDSDAAGAQVLLKPSSFRHHDEILRQSASVHANGRARLTAELLLCEDAQEQNRCNREISLYSGKHAGVSWLSLGSVARDGGAGIPTRSPSRKGSSGTS